MKTFKLSLLVALFAFAGNAVAAQEAAKPADKAEAKPAEADVKKDKDAKPADKPADKKEDKKEDAKPAVNLAALELAAAEAAKGTEANKAYEAAKKDASYFARTKAVFANHKLCMAKGAGALLVAGAVGYYVGTRVEKAEAEEQLPA
jgi:hypothetical protein